jgi:DNA-binding XRE family transcriptional regulator
VKKWQGQPFEEVLSKQLKNKEFKMLFEKKRFYLQIAHLVSELRAKGGYSQIELAKRAGVSQPQVARLERGDNRRIPTFETINKLLKALGYSMELNIKADSMMAA